eukprot:TRINITY_DN9491_c0_g1_i1.p1 TRINITY_DN9491_c0_g1~~TRINITY_DN9491_c0_g1_i1.p1  ORF type:complete len:196 (+),score=69.85 TRINITY_DN9491_c0_g1_i1:3-590(+)
MCIRDRYQRRVREYLEACIKFKHLVDPNKLKSSLIFPSGGIIYVLKDALQLIDNLVDQLVDMFQKDKDKIGDWQIKIHPETLSQLEVLKSTSERISETCQAIKKYQGSYVELVGEEEESRSKTNVDIPADVRTALKMSYFHSTKVRHVALMSTNKMLPNHCKMQKQLLFDSVDSVRSFLQEQIKLKSSSSKKFTF